MKTPNKYQKNTLNIKITTKNLGIASLFLLVLTLFLPYWSIGEINVTWLKLLVDTSNADLIGVLLLIIGGALLILKSDKTIALVVAIIGGAFPCYRFYKISVAGDFGVLTPSFGIGGYLLIAAAIIQVIAYFKVGNIKLELIDLGLLLLRLLPSYYMLTNHGWNKIINPEKWSNLGNSFTKHFGDLIDFANPMFGFLASFSESAGAILVLLGVFTQPAAVLLSCTMLVAALSHITGTGNPENALIYFSIFLTISLTGAGKYSLDSKFFSNNKN